MLLEKCQLVEECNRIAEYYLISRDPDGNELDRILCCFKDGIAAVDLNFELGCPLDDCIVTPAEGIHLKDVMT